MGQVECGASGSGAGRCVSIQRMVFTGQLPQYLCATVVAAHGFKEVGFGMLIKDRKERKRERQSPKYTRAQFWKQ